MFFAAGVVFHGIQFYKQSVESRGLRGELGACITLAAIITKVASGRGRKLFPPVNVIGHADGKPLAEEPYLGVIMSTMSGQFSGIKPYWGKEAAPIRCTTLRHGAKRVLTSVPTLFLGKPTRTATPGNGYRSFNAFEVGLDMDAGFTLDGELFAPPGRVRLTLDGHRMGFFLRRNAR
jgi:hypothetical protein